MGSLTSSEAQRAQGHRRGGPSGSARIGASMFAGGASVTLIGMLAPHSATTDVAGFTFLCAAQAVVAVSLLLLPRSLGTAWIPGAVVALSIATISAAILFSGERLGGPATLSELYFVWPALYVGYFFGRRGIVIGVGLVAVAYAATLRAMDFAPAAGFPRWMVTVSAVAGAAFALHAIRRRVDRLVAQLRELARTDPLTGLANRREFETQFEAELSRARRDGTAFALALGDIDLFKRLNDAHGHQAGDDTLRRVSRALTDTTRATDLCARVGGEEFAILMPGTSADEAEALVERVRQELADVALAAGRPLTMSFGLVEFPSHGSSMRELMHAGDVALYEAKERGRDRVVLAAAA